MTAFSWKSPSQPPLALAVPLSRFTSQVGGGSAFYVRPHYTFMKTSAAITLIVSGTVLILVPHIASVIGTAQVAHLIETTQKEVTLNGGLPHAYDLWTVVSGIVMVISGVIGAFKTRS